MKLQTVMILLMTLFWSGCSVKSGFFAEDAQHKSAMLNSKKGEIFNSLEMKASLVATYLNNTMIKCESSNMEVFLVAVYIDQDSSDPSKSGLLNSSYQLTLNDKKPIKVEALAYNDDLIQIAPFRNRWSDYYKVFFEKSKDKTLKMKYQHANYGKLILTFQKGYGAL